MGRRRVALIVLAIAVAVGVLAWIGSFDPRPRFEVSLPGGENFGDLPVVLRDGTGQVVTLQAADAPATDVRIGGSIGNPAGEPATLVVDWLGGACDDRFDMAFERQGSGYLLEMHTDLGFDLGCIAGGVRRTVGIELTGGVNADDVTLRWC